MEEHPPRLAALESLYRRGDFLEARKAARDIAAQTESAPEEKRRAEEILRATGVDPVAAFAMALTALVLAFLIAAYIF